MNKSIIEKRTKSLLENPKEEMIQLILEEIAFNREFVEESEGENARLLKLLWKVVESTNYILKM